MYFITTFIKQPLRPGAQEGRHLLDGKTRSRHCINRFNELLRLERCKKTLCVNNVTTLVERLRLLHLEVLWNKNQTSPSRWNVLLTQRERAIRSSVEPVFNLPVLKTNHECLNAWRAPVFFCSCVIKSFYSVINARVRPFYCFVLSVPKCCFFVVFHVKLPVCVHCERGVCFFSFYSSTVKMNKDLFKNKIAEWTSGIKVLHVHSSVFLRGILADWSVLKCKLSKEVQRQRRLIFCRKDRRILQAHFHLGSSQTFKRNAESFLRNEGNPSFW